jgi:ketosteroid isomerase-like protein
MGTGLTPAGPEVLMVERSDDQAALQVLADWYRALERCVRAVDFTGGRDLFAEDVVAFGTRAEVVTGLEALERQQWQGIWPNIRDFTFVFDQLHAGHDGNLAWGVVPFMSTGFHPDGTPFERPGRATIILERRDGRWLAKHSHFSLYPGTPPTTHGAR